MDKRLRTLSSLRYFEAAARLQSYSKAADELFVSQAAVSQTIRRLEDDLDCKLFQRKGRGMALTSKGQTLLEHVALGFEQVICGLNKIQNEPLDGLLKVLDYKATAKPPMNCLSAKRLLVKPSDV